jgi:hypothetical protein
MVTLDDIKTGKVPHPRTWRHWVVVTGKWNEKPPSFMSLQEAEQHAQSISANKPGVNCYVFEAVSVFHAAPAQAHRYEMNDAPDETRREEE